MDLKRMKLPLAAAVIAGLGGIALAQDGGTPPAKGAGHEMSPFEFAESGKKGEALKGAEAADGAGRVIGGEIAGQGAWPWQVALVVAGAPLGPDAQFCGGSLVLDNWVLTAAHCVHMADQNGTYRDVPAERIAVVAGTNTLAPGQGDTIPVQQIFVHPEYVGTEFDNDIALIKLARAPQGVSYKTITVPDADFGEVLDQPGVPTIVTGWGLVNGGGHPAEMHQAEIQMMSRDMCNGAIMEARANEAAFAAWLDLSKVPYLYAEQSRETFSAGLRGSAKRPDFLIGLPYLRPLSVDVKIKTSYEQRLIFYVAEVEKLQVFSQLFNTVGLFACIAPSGSPLMKWLPLDAFNGRQASTINGAPAYAVPLKEALTIDSRDDFGAALKRLHKTGR